MHQNGLLLLRGLEFNDGLVSERKVILLEGHHLSCELRKFLVLTSKSIVQLLKRVSLLCVPLDSSG